MNERKTQKPEADESHESMKPSHVRKLNFGQTILTLDVVEEYQGQKDGALMIDRNVAIIPRTEKGEFVRKWIETHSIRGLESDELSPLSPILGSSFTQCSKTSPTLGNTRKRVRRKGSLNNSATNNIERARSGNPRNQCNKEIFDSSVQSLTRVKHDASNKKENIRRNLFNSQSSTTHFKASNANVSPVLDKNVHSYKRRRRKFEEETTRRKALDRIENKFTKVDLSPSSLCSMAQNINESPILDRNSYVYKRKRRKSIESRYVDANMNSVISCNLDNGRHMKSKCKIMCSQKQRTLIKKLETNFQNDNIESSVGKDSKILENSIESDSPVSGSKVNIEDSPKDVKDIAKMEIESSDEDNDECKDVNINSDTDQELSDKIEDADTQDDAIPAMEIRNHGLKHSIFHLNPKSASVSSQISNNDSDRTFFSKAEELRSTFSSLHPSQRISQISSQVNCLTDNKSSQTEILITTETSPQRTNPDPFAQLSLLDSGKKRKKPKRGSLSEKLQSAINRQVSFVRIWRHKLKQLIKDNTTLPCVTIYVYACVVRFSRQFLEGIVIQDQFGLLPHSEKSNSSRFIRIMTIPEIVGKLEMQSKSIVQIFPPWKVLDDNEPMLNITYFNILFDKERIDVDESETSIEYVKRPVVKEYDCPCITARNMILSCTNRLNKPDVIEKLFTD